MASSTPGGNVHEGEIRMWPEGDGWVVTHMETGHEPTDTELREIGIDGNT